MSDKFFKQSQAIMDAQNLNVSPDKERGYVLVRSQEIGIWHTHNAPRSVTEARVAKRYTNTPTGHRLWEEECQKVTANIKSFDVNQPTTKPAATSNLITVPLST